MRNWILRDYSDDVLMEAIERNHMEQVFFLPSRHPHMQVITQDDFVIVDTTIPDEMFNYICTTRYMAEDIENKILKAEVFFREKNQPFSWLIGPTAPLDVFQKSLVKIGFSLEKKTHCMLMNLELFRKKLKYIPQFRVQQALTKSTLLDVAKVHASIAQGRNTIYEYFQKISSLSFHPLDPIKFFVGYLDEQPKVVGQLYLGAGIAGIDCVGSFDNSDQAKQLMMDLVTKMLLQGKQQGYHWAIMKDTFNKAEEFSYLGFKKYCEFSTYLRK